MKLLILAAALLALLWWKRPRRREIDDWHRAHTYVESEDGVQVDPRLWTITEVSGYNGPTFTANSSDRYIGTWTGWAKEIIH